MNENTLILMVGLPQSGKTTWAKKQGFPIVNPDAIRLALHGQRFQPLAEPMVWVIAAIMVRSLFRAGHDTVIVDATNVSRKRRDAWEGPEWRRVFKLIPTDAGTCMSRAREAEDEEIIPVIERMEAEFEPVTKDEGGIWGLNND